MMTTIIDVTFLGLIAIAAVSLALALKDRLNKKNYSLNAKEEMQKLHSYLKDLIKDAAAASEQLNEQLMLRKQELEVLLRRLEEAESAISEPQNTLKKQSVSLADEIEVSVPVYAPQGERTLPQQQVRKGTTSAHVPHVMTHKPETSAPVAKSETKAAEEVPQKSKQGFRIKLRSNSKVVPDASPVTDAALPSFSKLKSLPTDLSAAKVETPAKTDLFAVASAKAEKKPSLINKSWNDPIVGNLDIATSQSKRGDQSYIASEIEVVNNDSIYDFEFIKYLDPITLKIARRLFSQGYSYGVLAKKLDMPVTQVKTLDQYFKLERADQEHNSYAVHNTAHKEMM